MNQKRYHYEINDILKRKELRLCNMFKIQNSLLCEQGV
jgi:hypothetical protein